MKTVAVIGSGSWGTALAVQLKRAGNNVILWSFNITILGYQQIPPTYQQ